MSSDEIAIRVRDVSKHYLMFARPEDRLKQMIVPRLQRMVGRAPRRYYRDFAALGGVSFDIRRGETVGIIGRNGSGKSTLLQVICGTLQPSTGSVTVQGRIAALLELGSGFNPEFTGRENVYINAAILGLSREETDARFEAIARFADIGDFIEQPVKTYSSGMYVRLAFATAINVDPNILVVDEALAVGDEAFQRKCYARIEDIQDKGGTILFVSHGMQSVVQLCSRALLFDGGELLLDGRPKLVTSQYQRLVNASPEAAREIRESIREMAGALAATAQPAPDAAVTQPAMNEYRDDTGRAANGNPQIIGGEAAGGLAGAVADVAAPAIEPPAAAAAPTNAMTEQDAASAPATAAAWEQADYFDPNLVSQSTVYLEERGARIRDVRILTLTGKPVNVLRMGRRYTCEFSAEFTTEVSNIGFGIFITNPSGLGLSGAQTILSKAYRTAHATDDTVAHVSIEFSCLFLPGAYFLTVGIRGTTNEGFRILHKIEDSLMFRIADEPDQISVGKFFINPTPRVRLRKQSNY